MMCHRSINQGKAGVTMLISDFIDFGAKILKAEFNR
jgi:hypothetical protein